MICCSLKRRIRGPRAVFGARRRPVRAADGAGHRAVRGDIRGDSELTRAAARTPRALLHSNCMQFPSMFSKTAHFRRAADSSSERCSNCRRLQWSLTLEPSRNVRLQS